MSEDIDPITEEKQNYLRENILEKNYDVNVFVSFLIEKKGEGGADIANWSFPDLKAVVSEFISLNNNNQANNNNEEKNKIEENENKIEENENKIEENIQKEEKEEQEKKEKKEEVNDWINVEEHPKDKKEEIQNEKETKEIGGYGIKNLKEVKCQTVPNNEFSKCENIQIKVGSFEKVGGKLFSKSYITYLITTMPLNLKVRRRFSDFEWLHQILINTYNYCLIPSIPKKKKNLNKIVSDKFDEAFLRKRSRKFEKFLNYLINDPILKNLKIVYDFLSIEKEEEFQKSKKAYEKNEKKKSSSNINDFVSLDGYANVEINSEKEKYLTKIKENTINNDNTLKKINSTIKSLKDDLINASTKLKDISKNWNLMKKKAIEYNEKDDVVQSYEELSSMFDNLSLYISKQNYVIFIYLREYFKFVKNNYHSMKEFIHIGENLKNSFYKSLKNLKSKKEDLFKKPETITKWEIDPKDKTDKKTLLTNKELAMEKMLYKETMGVNNQKQMYGFYLNRIISEHERMKNVNAERHLNGLLKVFERQTNSTTDFITGLADNSTALSMAKKEGKKMVKKKERKVNKEDYEETLDLEIKKEGDNNIPENEGDKGQE